MMKSNHYFLFQSYLFLSISVLLNAQGNHEPPHACFGLDPGKVVPVTSKEFNIESNQFKIEFPTGRNWYHQQIFARIPGVNIPYSLKINGINLGTNPGSGATFEYNITPFLKEILNTIILEPEQSSNVSGMGFFNPREEVFIVIRSAIHVRDVQITSFYEPAKQEALVRIHLFIKSYLTEKEDDITFRYTITDPEGNRLITGSRVLNSHLSFGQETEIVIDETLQNPILWSPRNPFLYELELKQMAGRSQQEIVSLSFGIREALVNDSIMVFNGDSLVIEMADDSFIESLLQGNSVENSQIITERTCNTISTNSVLPCYIINLFNHHGMVLLRKKEQYEPFSDHPHFNSPSFVIME